MGEPAVVDVTFAERLLGKEERSAHWKEGLDLGLDFSGKRIAQLTLDLSLTRTKLAEARNGNEERERLLQHWKSEAQWWHEEHDKIRDEYHAFVKEMARRFARK
jgi:hypothetical protein